MSASSRDDFSAADIRTLGERAAYICSNPDCRQPTIGPHSDPNKSLKTGKACHIKAASEGGPRYDSSQNSDERKNIENGIWLCSKCSDLIDKDIARFVVDKLLDWRRSHEGWIRDGGVIPETPALKLTTLRGLTIPNEPGEYKLDALKDVREHVLTITNPGSSELLTIQADIQFPEPVVRSTGRYKPVGVNASWEPDLPQMVASGSPGATVSRSRGPLPTNKWRLEIDRLPPGQRIEIAVITSLKPWQEHDISFDTPLWRGINDPPNVMHYIDGKYQFEYRGARPTRMFFAPIAYDEQSRDQSLREVRCDYGTWKPVRGCFWS